MILVAPDHIEAVTGRLIAKKTAAQQRAISGKYLFHAGDIVYSKIRPYLRKAVLANFSGLCSADMYPLKPATDVSSRFMLAVLLGHHFSTYAESVSVRSGMPKINRAELADYSFALPPPTEQRAIAAALSDVEALLDGLTRLIAKKRDLKQAAMQQLLTGQTRLPGFDGEWKDAEFGDIAAIRNSKVIASTMSAGTRCVELESIGQGTGQLLGSVAAPGSSAKYTFRKGDVLFGRLRAYLRKYWLATFDGICSTEIWPLVPRDERLCRGFLHLLIQTSGFADAAGVAYGTHMPRSDWSVLRKLSVQVPPPPEQTAIAAVLSDMDAELSALEARRNKIRALKQAMMQELLTGKTRLV